ncbi:GNAT family N-acetyltransferase [Xenophilus sp. Marseille-Q4582]|uniref:GNAT family N-acetyltransferase n=1 Tax=Xenophilus sp. Marseille-Q4582 TaxID=2866600 RepID=UPI001CE3DCD1|nr:N-acetyltransferase [Xenophilus sp. Marseille-Q4582]
MIIRTETTLEDSAAIARVIERAFASAEHTSHTEQFIVRALRAAGALTVSLVAEKDRRIVGHVAYSPVTISSGVKDWYGLGPLAVDPDFQSQGIGAALVRAGIERLRTLSAAGCVVLGDPAYYGRFGFKVMPGLVYPGPPSEYFMAQALSGFPPQGEVAYHAAFASEA